MEDKSVNAVQAIWLVQKKLGDIPYSLASETTIGQPIRECVLLLEKIKEAVTQAASGNVHTEEQ